jgi:hypothetical protein
MGRIDPNHWAEIASSQQDDHSRKDKWAIYVRANVSLPELPALRGPALEIHSTLVILGSRDHRDPRARHPNLPVFLFSISKLSWW